MAWWELVLGKLNVGDELLTPGRGLQGSRRKSFKVIIKSLLSIHIVSGNSTIPLERLCFDTVEKAFSENPLLWLRVAALHESEPFENSVDKLVRDATGSRLARGNYICSILEHCGLLRYSMRGNRKVVELA
jgi:hypothetical protein